MISTKQMQYFIQFGDFSYFLFYSTSIPYADRHFLGGIENEDTGISGNGSWKREFLPGVETLRDTSTMHISCFLVLFSSSFLPRENTTKLPKLVVTYSTSCSFYFRLGDFLRVRDTANHDFVSYP